MHRKLILAAALLAFVSILATPSFADELTDELISNPTMIQTIGKLAAFGFISKTLPENEERAKNSFKGNYWAFFPDVHLTDAESAAESQHIDATWNSMKKTSADYDIREVSFIGCDSMIASHCMDMYFAAATLKGPVLFKFSMEFKVSDRARLFNVEIFTGWDKVKALVRNIEHPVSDARVPTFTYNPKDETPKDKDAKAPDADNPKN